MGAGPWYSTSGLGDHNQALVSKTIQAAFHASAKNMDAIGSPVMRQILAADQGLGPLLNALGVSIGLAAIGQAKAAPTNEGTAAASTNFSLSAVTLTPARFEFARTVSDYAQSLGVGSLTGELGPDAYSMLVYEGYRIWANTLVDTVVAFASTAATEIGTTALPLTWAAMQTGTYSFKNSGSRGRVLAFLTEKGLNDLATDAMTLGGAVQMSQQVQQFLNAGTEGAYVGTFFGGLDLYLNSELDTDGGDTLGIAFTADGIHTKHQAVPFPAHALNLANAGFYRMELRRPGGAIDLISTDMYLSAGIKQTLGLKAIRYVT